MKTTTFILTTCLCVLSATLSYAQLRSVTYSDGAQKLNGLAAPPRKAPENISASNPGVLILPAWMGIDDNAKSAAEKLSAEGYFAFIADIYGEGNYPKDDKSAGEISSRYKKNPAEYRKRIQLALNELVKSGADARNIVIIGYCFGGTGALEAARGNLKAKGVVSFHGGLARDTTRPVMPIQPKVLVCHGANDVYVPDAQVKAFQNEMRQGKADWQMIYYADAVHAFTDKSAGNDPSKGTAYNEKAAKRSWQHFMDFLQELFS